MGFRMLFDGTEGRTALPRQVRARLPEQTRRQIEERMTVRTVDTARWQQLCHATRERLARKGTLDRHRDGTLDEAAATDGPPLETGRRSAP